MCLIDSYSLIMILGVDSSIDWDNELVPSNIGEELFLLNEWGNMVVSVDTDLLP